MNAFDEKLKSAQKSYLGLQLVFAVLVLIVGLAYFSWAVLLKGVAIEIKPPEAAATAEFNVLKGVGFFVDDYLYALNEQVSIVVDAERFIPVEKQIDTATTRNVIIEMLPKPSRLKVSLDQPHAAARWYLDGALIHQGANAEFEVKAGQHQLKIVHPFYQPIGHSFSIQRGELLNLDFKLQPVQGKIQFDSEPTGAEVWLDQQKLGATPYIFTGEGGEYLFEIRQQNYQTIADTIQITHDQPEHQRHYQLKPKQARINLDLSPADGVLKLNGQEIAKAESISVDSMRTHSLSYQKPGHQTFTTRFELQPEQSKNFTIQLKKQYGKLALKANVTADIYINNRLAGQTPKTVSLLTVQQQIEFRKAAYRTVKKTIIPTTGQTKTVQTELLTEYAARRKAGKPTVAQQLGIQMKSFRLTPFTQGSPVNEKGRRRNEAMIEVRFTKPIYVSQHEITEAQFNQFRGAGTGSKLPVSDITWLEAVQFCNWLSREEGLPEFYLVENNAYKGFNAQSNGYRLPTEAEWEWLAKKAKRAVETTFVWGMSERLPQQAGNFSDQSAKGQHTFYFKNYTDGFAGKAPVGSFKADRIGLYDLAGNVSEWVHDVYTNRINTQAGGVVDPFGAKRGVGHVYKGGNYQSGQLKRLRAAFREQLVGKDPGVGFRVVRYH
jgi:formylglycine-generating enzyme required for sulfatase activity